MFKFFVALLVTLFSQFTSADTIGFHVGSWHSDAGYNNVNPGVYYKADSGLTIGGYCNSESRSKRFKSADICEVSAYVGYTKDYAVTNNLRIGGTAFLVTGYQKAKIIPAAAASILIADHLRVMVIPEVKGYTPMVVSFGIETKF